MPTLRLSEKGRELAAQARREKGWNVNAVGQGACKPLQIASKIKIRDAIESNNWQPNQLTFEQIEDLVNQKVLDDDWLEVKISNLGSSKMLGLAWIEECIEQGGLLARGLKPATWRRYLKGDPIDTDSFWAFSKALELPLDEIIDRVSQQSVLQPLQSPKTSKLNEDVRSSVKNAEPASLDSDESVDSLELSSTDLEEYQELRKDISASNQDWGDAPVVDFCYGRDEQISTLQNWILNNRCRLILIHGVWWIGKTSVAVKISERVKDKFDSFVWRSLQNATPLKDLLADLIEVLSNKEETEINLRDDINSRIRRLIHYLSLRSSLVVLDNFETVLLNEESSEYRDLLRQVGQGRHQSCFILTSRVKPNEIIELEGDRQQVKSILLDGLKKDAHLILEDKGLQVTEKNRRDIVEACQGNPGILKRIPFQVNNVFGGNISKFLEQGSVIVRDAEKSLDWYFELLSVLEKSILYWLAINREPLSFEELCGDILLLESPRELASALEHLTQLDLIELNISGDYTLQNVIMDYFTKRFNEAICNEVFTLDLSLFKSHALIKAQSKDYVREMQIRLIVERIKEILLKRLGYSIKKLEDRFLEILSVLRATPSVEMGYAGGNLINLMSHMGINLTGYDFSRITIWQAYLRGVDLNQVSFAFSNIDKTTFTESIGSVLSLAFSPDGHLLAVGDARNEIRLWQVIDGKQIAIYKGHTNWIRSIAFNPDGKTLASCSEDLTIRIWSVSTGECITIMQGHTHWIRSISYNSDGQILASAGDDKTIRLWNLNTYKCLAIWEEENDVNSISFSSDNQSIASGGDNEVIKLWDVKSGHVIRSFKGHKNWVWSVCFSPDGKTLASGSEDQSIRLWDVRTGKCLKVLTGHTYRVRSVCFSPDGKTLASGSEDQSIRLWDVGVGECLKVLTGHTYRVRSVCFSPNGKILASGSDDTTVKLWEANTESSYLGRSIRTFQGHSNGVEALAYSPDGKTLASGSEDRNIRLWNVDTQECFKTFRGHTNLLRSLAFSPDSQTLASASDDSTIRLWNLVSGECFLILKGHTNWVSSIAYSPDGLHIISGSGDHTVKLWDLSTGQCLKTLSAHDNWIWSVAFSPDGRTIATSSEDKTTRLWDIVTGQCLKTFQGHSAQVWSVAFSPDGRTIATSSEDKSIKLWDIITGECLNTLNGHTSRVWTICYSPDGLTICSGSSDYSVRLWSVLTGECLITCRGHSGRILSTAFSPTDHFLASGSQDETIRIWNAKDGSCVKNLRIKKPYEGMNIYGVTGLKVAQKTNLKLLGAVEFQERKHES